MELALFLRQLATLVKAGIPIVQCCQILENSHENKMVRTLLASLTTNMFAGKQLSISMKMHPYFFDKLTCELVKIGEHSGHLPQVLTKLADFHEQKIIFIKKIKQTLFYPSVLIVTALLLCIVLLTLIIPHFIELFANTDVSLPLITRCIFKLSQWLSTYFFIWLSLSISIIAAGFYYRKQVGCFIKSWPMIQLYFQKQTLARFSRYLALLFTAGLPLTEGLKLMAVLTKQTDFSYVAIQLRSKIQGGAELHQAMQSLNYFPQRLIQMVKIGEESGMLPVLLNKYADLLEAELEHTLSAWGRLAEPLIMLSLGVLIGGLVIGMYLPIFKLGSAFA